MNILELEALSHPFGLPKVNKPSYDGHIARFNRWNANMPINKDRITKYFEYLQSKAYKASTINSYKYALKKSILSCITDIRQLYLLNEFFKTIENTKKDKKIYREKIIKKNEYEEIIKKAPKKFSLMCEVLYRTGLRITELLSIRLDDCQIIRSYVYISIIGKGFKERRVIIPRELYSKIIEEYQSKEYLFCSKRKKPYSREYISRKISSITHEILGRKINPHNFRHSFATRLIKSKKSVKAVSLYMGHASTGITEEMYVHDELGINDLFPSKIA